jgi:hypothetical protein
MQSDKSTYSASFFLSKLEIIPSSSFVLSNDIPVLMIHNDDYRLIRLDICLSSLHDSSFRPLSAISTVVSHFMLFCLLQIYHVENQRNKK